MPPVAAPLRVLRARDAILKFDYSSGGTVKNKLCEQKQAGQKGVPNPRTFSQRTKRWLAEQD